MSPEHGSRLKLFASMSGTRFRRYRVDIYVRSLAPDDFVRLGTYEITISVTETII
jgi:hypothetical protein